MELSWIEQAQQFKSRLSVVAGFLLRSRETQAKRAQRRTQQIEQLRKILEQRQNTLDRLRRQLAEKDRQIVRLERENAQLRTQPPTLPEDPPLPHHEFGPKMISLCVNLARRMGLRPVPDVLKMVFDWLGAPVQVPDWTTVRTGLLRVGVAAMKHPIEQADDWIWLADHSNQIGPEKALSIIGLRASNMPPPGAPLRHKDVRVLELSPGTNWKREDMAEAYQELAQRCGTPMAVLVDGAVELREGAEILQQTGDNVVVLGDFKHYAANVLKKIVGGGERFSQFSTRLGRTRSAIQQTELAHFIPPSPKPQARFMNLQPTLRWANMVSWQLSHPPSEARHGITADRMNEKLGWLREFRDDIDRWSACQEVVSASCTFINEQGLFPGVACRLRDHLRSLRTNEDPAKDTHPGRQVTASLLRFVRQSESKLADGQRVPMSTEILESSFGLFKRLERQHSKGGHKSLSRLRLSAASQHTREHSQGLRASLGQADERLDLPQVRKNARLKTPICLSRVSTCRLTVTKQNPLENSISSVQVRGGGD